MPMSGSQHSAAPSFCLLLLAGPDGSHILEYTDRAFHIIGKALGTPTLFVPIGDPRHRDALGEQVVLAQGTSLRRLSMNWKRTQEDWGGPCAAIHAAEDDLLEQLGLNHEDLPCVVLFVAGSLDHRTPLRIDSRCLGSAKRARLFWSCVTSVFRPERVMELVGQAPTSKPDDLLKVGQQLINRLDSEISALPRPSPAAAEQVLSGSANRADDPEGMIRNRLPDDRAAVAIAALRALQTTGDDWLTRKQLDDVGLPATTLDEDCRARDKFEFRLGGEAEGAPVRYERAYVVGFIVSRWNPSGRSARPPR